jgi:hypothetical protein
MALIPFNFQKLGSPDLTHPLPNISRTPPYNHSEQYASLISAILTLSGGRRGYKVFVSSLRAELGEKGTNDSMREYGWPSVEDWIYGACLEGYLEQGRSEGCTWVTVTTKVSILWPNSGINLL